MKILLDECVPKRLGGLLRAHDTKTARQMGWTGIKNGELLRKTAEANFDIFLTVDRNLFYQQAQSGLPLPVVVLQAISNKLSALEPLVPELLKLLKQGTLERQIHWVPNKGEI